MSRCVHGNTQASAKGCTTCIEELLAARALCRAVGAAPAEVLEVLRGIYSSDAAWLDALAAARARLSARGLTYTAMTAGPVKVEDVFGRNSGVTLGAIAAEVRG